MAVFGFFKTGSLALAQDDHSAKTSSSTNAATNSLDVAQTNSAAKTTLETKLSDLRLGPFVFHPRLAAGFTYDNNILYSTNNKESDAIWMVQPAFQVVAGDDAALTAYRDHNSDILSLSPGNLIFQQPADWPGKLFILDYGPRFQIFDKYTGNDSIDEFATLEALWPMDKLILGFKQEYQLQKMVIIEAAERTTVELIPTTLSAAYQFGDKTSMESDFRRFSVGYAAPELIGYTEYNTEDWFNYNLEENLPVSLGVLAGVDEVVNHQDQDYEQLRARARYNYSQKLTFDASVGAELRQFENGHPEKLSPVFTVAGNYQFAERTSVRLTGYRQVYAAIYNGYNYTSTGAMLEFRQGITDRFAFSMGAGYYSLEYAPVSASLATHTDGYYTARASLDARLVRHLNAQIFYNWASRQSQLNGDINDDQAGIQLNLRF